MGKVFLYARVSSNGQNLESQVDELKKAYPDGILYEEKKSGGSKKDRVELKNMMKALGEGDTVAVWKLDRLGRNQEETRETLREIRKKGASFKIITMPLEFDVPLIGDLIIYIMGMVAEMERSNIRDNQARGIAKAKERGKFRGGVRNEKKWAKIEECLELGMNIPDIMKVAEVARSTVYRVNKEIQEKIEKKRLITRLREIKDDLQYPKKMAKALGIPREQVVELLKEIEAEDKK